MSAFGWGLYVARELMRRHPKPELLDIPIRIFTAEQWIENTQNARRITP